MTTVLECGGAPLWLLGNHDLHRLWLGSRTLPSETANGDLVVELYRERLLMGTW